MLSRPCKPRCTLEAISPPRLNSLITDPPCNVPLQYSFPSLLPLCRLLCLSLSLFFSHAPHGSLFSCCVYIPAQSASPWGGWLDPSTLAEPHSLSFSLSYLAHLCCMIAANTCKHRVETSWPSLPCSNYHTSKKLNRNYRRDMEALPAFSSTTKTPKWDVRFAAAPHVTSNGDSGRSRGEANWMEL